MKKPIREISRDVVEKEDFVTPCSEEEYVEKMLESKKFKYFDSSNDEINEDPIVWDFTNDSTGKEHSVELIPFYLESPNRDEYRNSGHVLITVRMPAVLEEDMKRDLALKAQSGKDGVIEATMLLESSLGYVCSRINCMKTVKALVAHSKEKGLSSLSKYNAEIVLEDQFWLKKEDVPKVLGVNGVILSESLVGEKQNLGSVIDSKIEWPKIDEKSINRQELLEEDIIPRNK